MSICRGFGCLRGGGRGGRKRVRGEDERRRRKRGRRKRREGKVNRVWVDEDIKSFPLFFFSFILIIDHHLPTNKMPLFPTQQYPSLMKNSPDPVWYSTP